MKSLPEFDFEKKIVEESQTNNKQSENSENTKQIS